MGTRACKGLLKAPVCSEKPLVVVYLQGAPGCSVFPQKGILPEFCATRLSRREKNYVKSPPERVPGDKFLSWLWKMSWNFRKFGEWQILSHFPCENMKENLPPKTFTLGGGGKNAKFHHLNLLGAALRKKKGPLRRFSAYFPVFKAEKGPNKSAPNPGYQWYARKSGKSPAQFPVQEACRSPYRRAYRRAHWSRARSRARVARISGISHPTARGGRQKGIGKKVTKSVRKSDKKVTKRWPKQKKVIHPLLRTPFCGSLVSQKRSGDPNPQYFFKSTAVQMGGVLPYKWEAYRSMGGALQGFPFYEA